MSSRNSFEAFTLEKAEIIDGCARRNDVAEVAILEFDGAHRSARPLNLFSPSHPGIPAGLIGVRDNGHVPARKVGQGILANALACAQHRDGKDILVLRGDELAGGEVIRPALHQENLLDALFEPWFFESRRKNSNGPALARTGQAMAFALGEGSDLGKRLGINPAGLCALARGIGQDPAILVTDPPEDNRLEPPGRELDGGNPQPAAVGHPLGNFP